MSSLEERVQALEQNQDKFKHDNAELKRDNAELKQKIELHTLAIGGLVNKTTLEAINEKNDAIFKALTEHDQFTNFQLGELREHVEVQLEGKVVGMQTEMRQRFAEVDGKLTELDGKIVGQQTEMRQRFAEVDKKFAEQDRKIAVLDNKVTVLDNKVTVLDNKVTVLDSKVAGLDGKFAGLQTTQAEHTVLLHQILARLPEKP